MGACSGDDLIVGGQSILVNAEYDGLEVIACGSRDDDLLGACVDVSLRLSLGAVEACALEHYVYADLTPGQLGSVCLCIDGDLLAVDDDGVLACLYGVQTLADNAAVTLLSCVVLEQVCEHSRVGEVVDSNYIITLGAEHLTESQTTDTAKAVDSNFY